MKRTLTLLFALVLTAGAFAQYRDRDSRDNDNSVYDNDKRNDNDRRNDNRWDNDNNRNRRWDENNSFTIRQRDELIARINREFNYKINDVRDSRYLKNREKRNRIRDLENERDQKIRMVYARFEHQKNKYNDKYYDKNYNWRR